MSTLTEQHSHDDHIHLPDPSYWPIALAMAAGLLPLGLLMIMWDVSGATTIMVLGSLLTVICLMGWANLLIKENRTLPDVLEDDRWMKLGLKLFLISEASAFGSLFAHHYYSRNLADAWPPTGAPHLDTTLPAIATLILMSSSVTMEFAHHLLKHGKRKGATWLTFITIVLGAIFLGFQGHEWGFLKAYDEFTLSSGTFGTTFYMMTGFHGAHVATGLIMLMIVWLRLKVGHYDEKRHFSYAAASWYWHFVDIVWIFLFFTIYLF